MKSTETFSWKFKYKRNEMSKKYAIWGYPTFISPINAFVRAPHPQKKGWCHSFTNTHFELSNGQLKNYKHIQRQLQISAI